MLTNPTLADRIGADWNLCAAHDACVAASAKVLDVSSARLPPQEQAPARAAYDKAQQQLQDLYATTRAAFTPRPTATTTH